MNSAPAIAPIYVHRYALRSGAALNSASVRREFHGALIKADGGHGCIHPWPEFGDAPIEEQLDLLSRGITTPLTGIALRCAQIDGDARRKGVSLFEGLRIPQCHYSWNSGQDGAQQIERVIQEKWPAIKAKGVADWNRTLQFLDRITELDACSDVKLRIDFNGCLERDEFEKFCEQMPSRVSRHLDFIEDPVTYQADMWRHFQERWMVRLALDKGWKSATDGFDAVVVKPSRRDWRLVAGKFPGSPLVLTSAMDHAFGQMFAAYEAAQANHEMPARISHCGLATEHLFERDPFFEQISSTGGILKLNRWGTGLGFDDALAQLPWKRLT